MKDIRVRVKEDKDTHTYRVTPPKNGISVSTIIHLFNTIKKQGYATIVETTKDGKTYWTLKL